MSVESRLNLDLDSVELVEPINWNKGDPFELELFSKISSLLWLPDAINLSSDIPSWNSLTETEQWATTRVFAGLTLLDTIQAKVGAISLIPDARTEHEAAILSAISWYEVIHAKSYSSVFSTLLSSREIEDAFRWAKEDPYLKTKAAIILHYYREDDAEKKKIASVMLESFLFYSGFFMPLWWNSRSKLNATGDIISLIIRDESIHGYIIGAWFQRAFKESSPERQAELVQFTNDLFWDLYENEMKYTASIYDELGLTNEVKTFLKYNANKAFDNLGIEAKPFSSAETRVNPSILSSLNPSDANTDFFSGSPNYVMGATRFEETDEDDWDF